MFVATRIYHVPVGASYARTRIDTAKGERWFCTEAEARVAGPSCAAACPMTGPSAHHGVERRGVGDRAGLAFRIDAAALARRHGHEHRPDRMPAAVVLPVKLSS